jgi:hypothetical protein
MNERAPIKVLQLSEPVQFGSETITELKFQKPKAKHLKGRTSDDMEYQLRIVANLTGQPTVVIDELCLADTMEALKVVGEFLPDSLKTGDPYAQPLPSNSEHSQAK